MALLSFIAWLIFYLKGKQFAVRDRLRQADAILVLSGTRGDINFLNGKIRTSVQLYQQGWAPYIIVSGKVSVKVTETLIPIPEDELHTAAINGRIQQEDIAMAITKWDTSLGAPYMYNQAVQMGVPPEAILVENESLHTRENAEYVLSILKEHHMSKVILVTSPFHQLRAYLTLMKVFHLHSIEIINYYADSGEWHPATWFLKAEYRKLVNSEIERIKKYREKGDLL
ncbi:MAG TPA: YdcF family protein [Ktedonobacteraceae bacterium]|nr:YdcF family protein [Ktedonobacteraceae bacterium]